jgi:predicted lipid-binding transport protein (Tim44 family)
MSPRRKWTVFAALAALVAALVALSAAPAAFAAAGGGSAGFSGGGGGGGFSGGEGGGHGSGLAFYLLFRVLIQIALLGHGLGFLFLLGLGLLYWFYRSGGPKAYRAWQARAQSGTRSRRTTRKRERRVELAAAEAADEDPIFGPDHVRVAAGALFSAIQFAWDAGDRIALRGLVAPELMTEWERRLDDLDRKGWRNRTQPIGEPTVEYVGIQNRNGTDADRVVVRIEAKMRDYVVDASGRHLKRAGRFTETVRLREYWTLARRGDRWILASIEQGAEGRHALEDQIVATEWSDEQALRDEALVEGAVATAVPAGTKIAEVADLEFAGDARAAANDLSLADGRFAPHVLEVAARRAVAAWAEAVDGSDAHLRAIADPPAVRDLLHPGDASGRTRLVVRGPQIRQIRIAALDAAAEPPTMAIDVDLAGRRYIEDRDTTQVLSGNPARAAEFTEHWTMALTGDAAQPWRIATVGTPMAA